MIGIDPDVEKNGVCIRNMSLRFRDSYMLNLPFWELIEWLNRFRASGSEIHVVIEAGHLNTKANFRSQKMTALASDKVSQHVGRNNQVGILLIEWCEKYQVSHELYRPLNTNRIHKECIVKAESFCALTRFPSTEPTNPETRSAGMLIFERSWPIKKPVR